MSVRTKKVTVKLQKQQRVRACDHCKNTTPFYGWKPDWYWLGTPGGSADLCSTDCLIAYATALQERERRACLDLPEERAINALVLPFALARRLRKAGYRTLGDLAKATAAELRAVDGVGPKALAEIEAALVYNKVRAPAEQGPADA